MTRPKLVQIVFVNDKIVAEARSQNDPYPSWSPFWAGEEPLDATAATPEQIGELVLATLEHSNNERWSAPEGWQHDNEVTPASQALGMKDMVAVRLAGAKFVGVDLRGETVYVDPMINEGRPGLRGKDPSIELPATSTPAELGKAVLETLEHSEKRGPMTRPKSAMVVLIDDKIAAEAWSQHDPYPAWGPFWAGEEPIDANTATPEQVGELVLATMEHSNNEPWRAPDGWRPNAEETPAARALGYKNLKDVRAAGARFVFVDFYETMVVKPTINEGRRGGLDGKAPDIEVAADASANELGKAVLDGLEIAE